MRVIYSPVAAMEAAAREQRVGVGFGVVALSAVLGAISAVVSVAGGNVAGQLTPQNFPQVPPDVLSNLTTFIEIGVPVSAAISPFVWLLLVTLLMQLVTGFFGGSGPISAMFAVVGVAHVPFLIAGVIGLLLSGVSAAIDSAVILGISDILLTPFLIWHVALLVIGASFARSVSYGESGGSCSISCAGCLGVIVVVIIGLALIGVLAGAAGGG